MRIDFHTLQLEKPISGGFHFNHRLLAALQAKGVTVRINPVEDFSTTAADSILIDSIVLPDLLSNLNPAGPDKVILMHAVPNISPNLLSKALTSCRVLATGKPCYRWLLTHTNLDEHAIQLAEPGQDQPWPQKESYPVRPESLLCMSNYVPGKGYPLLFELLESIKDLEWSMEIYGNETLEPAYYAYLLDRLDRTAVKDRIKLHKAVPHEQVPGILKRADLLLLLSESETFSMITREALSARLPVLSTRVGATELFQPTGGIQYFESAQARGMALELRALLTQEPLYQSLTRMKPLKVRSWNDLGEEVLAFLQSGIKRERLWTP